MCPISRRRRRCARGMSLAELLISLTILTMLAGIVATMAMAVSAAGEFVRGRGTAVQHARVSFDRIDRAIQGATVSESFPGFLVVSWSQNGNSFPDTLVVWKPATAAVDPTGVPRANELVIFRPDATDPRQLLEITNPSEPATVTYNATATANWQTLVTTLTARANANKVLLTDLVRTAATSTAVGSPQRAAIRFRTGIYPTSAELAAYRAGTATWGNLSWPQDLSGNTAGVRSLACFTEVQLVPSTDVSQTTDVLPFFGSSTIWKGVVQ